MQVAEWQRSTPSRNFWMSGRCRGVVGYAARQLNLRCEIRTFNLQDLHGKQRAEIR